VKKSGFTVVELLVVLTILAILLAIVLPSYSQYRITANRAAAKAFLLEIFNRQDVRIGQTGTYASTLVDLGLTIPADVQTAGYAVSITTTTLTLQAAVGTEPAVTMPGFTASATPAGESIQINDGTLTINQFGLKTPVNKW
jgi:type IV pilus assembly protein PilE